MFQPVYRLIKSISYIVICFVVCLNIVPGVADAGEFELDWSVQTWPTGSTGPLTFTVSDQYGFDVDIDVTAFDSGNSALGGAFSVGPSGQSPYLGSTLGGSVDNLSLFTDAAVDDSAPGLATVSTQMEFTSGNIAFAVDNLIVDILDVDSVDNNDFSDQCDFITLTGDNGNPSLAALSSTPSVVVGPGSGSGFTGLLDSNEAQCIYNSGVVASPVSNNNNAGTVRANYPNGTSVIAVAFDESIEDVVGTRVGENPAAREIGAFAKARFQVEQSITLLRSASPTTAATGENVTYTYTVRNNGGLPFNVGQDVVIEDTLLGTVSCPAITTPVAPGGTVVCSETYTIQASDAISGSIDSSAVAGIGAIGQPFLNRLQSDAASVSIVDNPIVQTVGPKTCTPNNIFTAPRTQLAGSGSASALTTSDIFVFDDVATDTSGNPIDAVFQANVMSNVTSAVLDTSLDARLTDVLDSHILYTIRLVQDGSATVGNPLGTTVEQSLINGVIVQQTDVDSTNVGDDTSDVVGVTTGNPTISTFNTVPISGFANLGTVYAMDPAKAGNPLDWVDEANESSFDNYVTYEFEVFAENQFVHGLTGTENFERLRGSGLLLCTISNVSADVIAADDNYTSTPVNALAGGTAGEVLANDTINGLPAALPIAELSVITPATPPNSGDPVPFLETTGATAGSVQVPPGVPAGLYTIEYRLCDAADPTDCDRALVTVVVFEGTGLDFGDAPVSYLSAAHVVPSVPTVYLGSVAPDTELVAQSDNFATADDLLGTDDEEGVVFPVLTQGLDAVLDINVTGNGFLQAWIDFNGDGVFEETLGERIAIDLQDDGTNGDVLANDGVIQIEITVPTDATTSQTFSRFRYGTEPDLTSTSLASDGEVEDHSLVIAAADFVDRGDAPASYGDPRHVVVPSIYLGAGLPDTEPTTQHSARADADDLLGIDDEDSVASWPFLVAGTTVSLTVQTHETLSDLPVLPVGVTEGVTYLQVFIDFDQSGTFDPSEQVATDYRDGGTGDTDGVFNNQITLDINVPIDIGNLGTFARIRWSTTSGVVSDPFDGLNADGEVEDYRVRLANPTGPLFCDDTLFMVATETSTNLPSLSELRVSESGGVYSLSQELRTPNYTGNYLVTGWGYNELDDYIYGVRQSPRTLMRVVSSGEVQEVTDISGLSIESPDTSSDILPNGIMLYMSGTNFGEYQLLDISDPSNPVDVGVLSVGSSANYGRDIAYNPRDGLVYFMDTNRNIFAFDPLNGTPGSTPLINVGTVPFPSGIFAMDPDSVWFDGSGFMYIFDNQSRQVFVVEVGEQGNRPVSYSFIEVQNQVNDLTYQGNDGVSCRAPGMISSTVFAEGTISGSLYFDTNGNSTLDVGEGGVAAITVSLYDDNGTPADPADDTLVQTTESAPDGTYLFSSVPSTTTYRIEVDGSDPETPVGFLIGTANPLTGVVVTQGAETTDQNFGYVAGITSADLSLTMQVLDTGGAPVTTAPAGTALDFVLTVTNDGPSNATGIKVIDLIPAGFTYVSDDAATFSDTFDDNTGLWDIGDLANGASVALTIRVTMNATGEHTNSAEIIAVDQADVDSDPAVGAGVDDLSDGIVDDDEATVTVALFSTGPVLSGTVFLDNGLSAGTAFDGAQNGGEVGISRATIEVFDNTGTLIDTPEAAADGTWSLTLPDGYSDVVTVAVTPDAGYVIISETSAALPSVVNPDPRDGSVTFTPALSTSYDSLDFGMLESARLLEDQSGVISGGQVTTLFHEYSADAPGVVDFTLTTVAAVPSGAYATAIYEDIGCDGSANLPITGPVSIDADTLICLVLRVSASSSLGPNASYVIDLTAETTYGATGFSEVDKNTDRLTTEANTGALTLSKTVRNVTQNGSDTIRNGGAPGDVLEYTIQLINPTALPVSSVVIYDRTPPYTTLAQAIPTPVSVGGMTCALGSPSSNSIGYSGNLRWDCSGQFAPGSAGDVTFRVGIAPLN